MSQPTTAPAALRPESAAGSNQSSPTSSGPQADILSRPEHVLAFALTLAEPDPRASLKVIRTTVRAEPETSLHRLGDAREPPAETRELGYVPNHDSAHLTITVGVWPAPSRSSAYQRTRPPSTWCRSHGRS